MLSIAIQKISGDVLIVEKPYATVLYPQYYATHCMQCFKRINENRQSCSGCQEVILVTLFSFHINQILCSIYIFLSFLTLTRFYTNET